MTHQGHASRWPNLRVVGQVYELQPEGLQEGVAGALPGHFLPRHTVRLLLQLGKHLRQEFCALMTFK